MQATLVLENPLLWRCPLFFGPPGYARKICWTATLWAWTAETNGVILQSLVWEKSRAGSIYHSRTKIGHPAKEPVIFVYCRYYFTSSLQLHCWSRTNKMYNITYKIWILFSRIFMLFPVITSSVFVFVNQRCYSSALFIKINYLQSHVI